jgi:two-component system cell cycle sensor histidine kinase/response regulator CckA
VWNVNHAAEVLQCGEVWHSPDVDITEFEEAVSRLSYRPGQGLAGEVWESGEPKWIADLIQDARTVGARIAINHGMGSAFCVPIKVRGEVQYVVEFFSPKISLPDPELLQTLGVVANQLGHLIERKSAEDALRGSEMRKAAILGSALDCVVSFDIDGRILEFNPAAERAFGISAREALGMDVRDLVAPEELRASHRPGIALFNAGGLHLNSGQRVEMLAKRRNGETFPVEAAISRINLDGPPMFTAFLRDITARKKAARLISELAAVVENTNDAVIGCTLTGLIRSWNTGAERIYGWTSQEAVGKSLEILLPPGSVQALNESLAMVRQGKSLADYEAVHVRKDGRKISVSVTDSPVRSERGEITGLSSIVRDITERKRLEEDLLQSQKMDAVGRLAGGIAHDFNNILTAILGYSDLIISRTNQREWMYKHLTEIRKAAEFAASLTHQLLAFSRRQPLFLRVFCINDTVRSMEKMLQRLIGERIRIKAEIQAKSGRLKADPSQLEQVLLNLCVNARDAMPHGGDILISTKDLTHEPHDDFPINDMPAGEYVQLSVRDSGTGIPPEVLKHIFEPFFTTKAEGHGTGLGLATCYGIVKQSGGYITVESTTGKGTTFCIFFPRVVEEVKAQTGPSVGDLPGGTETILYVEDEESVRSSTVHVLTSLGYTVLIAANGDGVLRVLESEASDEIDLLFSDVVLPDVGGRELADLVLEQRPGTRLLFTSGYMDDAMLRRHGIEETDAFLQKPFSPADLAHMIRQVMDSPNLAVETPVGS